MERAGYQHLEDIEPITVAAYIETLQRQAAPPTVKQKATGLEKEPECPLFPAALRKTGKLSRQPLVRTDARNECGE